uniref:hypothetical protein n=1 Tax=Candidatus Electronema sp. TaxID=2698783 RepID=UPI0040573B0C
PVREQQGDVQLGFGNVDSEDAHLTDTHDKTSCKLNLANAGFRRAGPLILSKFQQEKTGDAGALSTSRTLGSKGQNGIRLSLLQPVIFRLR